MAPSLGLPRLLPSLSLFLFSFHLSLSLSPILLITLSFLNVVTYSSIHSYHRLLSTLVLETSTTMRFENWDVLLFPESSKTPVQEFKTQCFVTRDRGWSVLTAAWPPLTLPESPYLHSPSILNPAAYFLPQGNLGQLAVLTTFVPSLPHNAPFRVSIHSWDMPRPSRLMESLMQPDDALLFEIRVFIDGICVS